MREHESGDDDDFIGPRLMHVIEVLRADVPVRPAWRTAVLDAVPAARTPTTLARALFVKHSVRLAPASALAACLVAMAAGAAGGIAFTSARSHIQIVPPKTAPGLTPVTRSDAGRAVIRFALVAPGALRVSLVGDFNGWNAQATPMQPARDGATWLVEMPLVAGRHLYAFVVDGDLVADPSAPRVTDDDFGVQNSVVLVGAPLP